jgi:bacterioferritin-associated ferredoxin
LNEAGHLQGLEMRTVLVYDCGKAARAAPSVSSSNQLATMIVCVCRRISDRDIHRAAREGVGSFDDLQAETGVGTACGSCVDYAQDTWDEACQCAGAQASLAHRTFEIRAIAA